MPVRHSLSAIAAPLGVSASDELSALVVTQSDYGARSSGPGSNVHHVVRIWLLRKNRPPQLLLESPQRYEVIARARARLADADDQGRLLVSTVTADPFIGGSELASYRLDFEHDPPLLVREWSESFSGATIVVSELR
ncbi:MAG: hypothetical protein JNK05_33070 [Myxococcales bacterium]|nr:hypothetical protein [Myxococcales bacterium]